MDLSHKTLKSFAFHFCRKIWQIFFLFCGKIPFFDEPERREENLDVLFAYVIGGKKESIGFFVIRTGIGRPSRFGKPKGRKLGEFLRRERTRIIPRNLSLLPRFVRELFRLDGGAGFRQSISGQGPAEKAEFCRPNRQLR
jgi:hypothetical protein